MAFAELARLVVDPDRARVYEHGWQSWSPTTVYTASATSSRPTSFVSGQQHYRPNHPRPDTGFQGEGLLAIDTGTDRVVSFEAGSALAVPSIRAYLERDTMVISADGMTATYETAELADALTGFGDRFAATCGVESLRQAPTVWSYRPGYSTVSSIGENMEAIRVAELDIDVVHVDDGWQASIGDWLHSSEHIDDLASLAAQIREAGFRAGIWIAPFLATADSWLAREHPEWLINGTAGRFHGKETYGVCPVKAHRYLDDVFLRLAEIGFDYFELDFLYAGALGNIADYRHGLSYIREILGPDPYLVGGGAPILPSVGLCDAMRIGPDVAMNYEPASSDLALPSSHGATMNTRSRAWQHGRFWVNDSDSLIARPDFDHREEWAETVDAFGGLRSMSDSPGVLDAWGLETTRRLLADVPPVTPFDHELVFQLS